MFIVKEDILDRLVCCQCKKYLSVKPIKVYHNRDIKCGRCAKEGDAGVVSFYGILANEALFPCVNRFDGCCQLLRYSESASHEETCTSKAYECPICVKVFKGSSYYIYRHFQELHPEALLFNNSEFILDIDSEVYNNYLYRKNNLLFFVVVQYFHVEQTLNFTTLFLGENCHLIPQTVELCSLDRQVKYKSRKKPCSSAVVGGDIGWIRVNIEEQKFPKKVVICKFSLDTEQLESLQRLPPDRVKGFSSNFKFSFSPPMDLTNGNDKSSTSYIFASNSQLVTTTTAPLIFPSTTTNNSGWCGANPASTSLFSSASSGGSRAVVTTTSSVGKSSSIPGANQSVGFATSAFDIPVGTAPAVGGGLGSKSTCGDSPASTSLFSSASSGGSRAVVTTTSSVGKSSSIPCANQSGFGTPATGVTRSTAPAFGSVIPASTTPVTTNSLFGVGYQPSFPTAVTTTTSSIFGAAATYNSTNNTFRLTANRFRLTANRFRTNTSSYDIPKTLVTPTTHN